LTQTFVRALGILAAIVVLGTLVYKLGQGNVREEYVIENGRKKVVIEWYNYGTTTEFLDLYESLIRDFEKTHPNIKIRPNWVMGDTGYEAKLLTLIAGQIPPDIVHVTYNNFPLFASRGILQDLTPLIESDPTFRVEDYYPQVLDGMRVGGRLYGIPSDFSTILLFYNKNLFDKYKVPYPDETWDWNKFLWAAKKLTADTDGDGLIDQFGFSNVAAYNRWPAWVWMAGGDIMTPDLKRCLMDQPEAIRGLKFDIELSTKHHVSPTVGDTTTGDFEQMFMSEQVAMIADSRYAYKKFLGLASRKTVNMPFRWDLAHRPKGPVRRATTFIWGGNVMLKSSKHKKEAWEFLKYISEKEGARLSLKLGNACSPYRPSERWPEAHPKNAPPSDHLFLQAIRYAKMAPNPPPYSEFTPAQERLSDAWPKLRTPEEVCKRFAEDVNRAVSGEVW